MSRKNIVRYDADKIVQMIPGGGAILAPVDHPDEERVSNVSHVLTSRVISFDTKNGIIETENTIYIPKKKES